MNRKLISEAISNIDDSIITESMVPPAGTADHAPERTMNMESKNKAIHPRRIIGLLLAACLIFSLAVTAYAADIGGIRRIIQIWLHGNQTTAILDIQNGQYTLTDEDGSFIRGGGGVAFEADGSERRLTEEEILEHLDQPDLLYHENGTIWISFRGQELEITDKFDEDGLCHLELRDGNDVFYVTVEKNGGMSISPHAYIEP